MAAKDFAITREEYRDLEWVVQVNYNVDYARSWESMAAFNSRAVAINYAKDCSKSNPPLLYRVRELSKLQPTSAIIFEIGPKVPA